MFHVWWIGVLVAGFGMAMWAAYDIGLGISVDWPIVIFGSFMIAVLWPLAVAGALLYGTVWLITRPAYRLGQRTRRARAMDRRR